MNTVTSAGASSHSSSLFKLSYGGRGGTVYYKCTQSRVTEGRRGGSGYQSGGQSGAGVAGPPASGPGVTVTAGDWCHGRTVGLPVARARDPGPARRASDFFAVTNRAGVEHFQ